MTLHARGIPGSQWWGGIAVTVAALFALASYDLLSPPISPTIWRQTQTAMLSHNFMRSGFRLSGLTLDILGPERAPMVYEFPLYNAIVGVLFRIFGPAVFWAKLVSLIASAVALVQLLRIAEERYGPAIARAVGVCFLLSPIGLMMYSSVQPDTLGLAFILLGIRRLANWARARSLGRLAAACCWLLLGGLCKWPLLVPFLPLLAYMGFTRDGQFRLPHLSEWAVVLGLFCIPLIAWYLYRTHLTHPLFESQVDRSMFLVGDLRRFLSLDYYVRPVAVILFGILCGAGVIFFAAGLRPLGPFEWSLLLGIPLYYVLVPTVADQVHYLLATVPHFALFTGRGIVRAFQSSSAIMRRARWPAAIVGLLGFVAVAQYTLRQDTIMPRAAALIRRSTAPDDLIFSVNMHDRTNGVGGLNPSIFFLAQRRGWNAIAERPPELETPALVEQANQKRLLGARWLVVTWYTPDFETWLTRRLPRQFRREPYVNGAALASALATCYAVASRAANVAILDLTAPLARPGDACGIAPH